MHMEIRRVLLIGPFIGCVRSRRGMVILSHNLI